MTPLRFSPEKFKQSSAEFRKIESRAAASMIMLGISPKALKSIWFIYRKSWNRPEIGSRETVDIDILKMDAVETLYEWLCNAR